MTEDEIKIDVEKINKFETIIKKHRNLIAVIFAIIFFGMLIYTVINYEQLFTKTYMYESNDGVYSCNESYRFGRNLTPKCIIPDRYLNQNLPNGFPIINITS